MKRLKRLLAIAINFVFMCGILGTYTVGAETKLPDIVFFAHAYCYSMWSGIDDYNYGYFIDSDCNIKYYEMPIRTSDGFICNKSDTDVMQYLTDNYSKYKTVATVDPYVLSKLYNAFLIDDHEKDWIPIGDIPEVSRATVFYGVTDNGNIEIANWGGYSHYLPKNVVMYDIVNMFTFNGINLPFVKIPEPEVTTSTDDIYSTVTQIEPTKTMPTTTTTCNYPLTDEQIAELARLKDEGFKYGIGHFEWKEQLIWGNVNENSLRLDYATAKKYTESFLNNYISFKEVLSQFELFQAYPDFVGGTRVEYWFDENGDNKIVLFIEAEQIAFVDSSDVTIITTAVSIPIETKPTFTDSTTTATTTAIGTQITTITGNEFIIEKLPQFEFWNNVNKYRYEATESYVGRFIDTIALKYFDNGIEYTTNCSIYSLQFQEISTAFIVIFEGYDGYYLYDWDDTKYNTTSVPENDVTTNNTVPTYKTDWQGRILDENGEVLIINGTSAVACGTTATPPVDGTVTTTIVPMPIPSADPRILTDEENEIFSVVNNAYVELINSYGFENGTNSKRARLMTELLGDFLDNSLILNYSVEVNQQYITVSFEYIFSINGDNCVWRKIETKEINLTDVVTLYKVMYGNIETTNDTIIDYDYNGDGVINILDFALAKRKILTAVYK